MKIRTIVASWDFLAAVAVGAAVAFELPRWVRTDLAKDLYAVGISVLSIIFAVFFAALALIIANTADDFVQFMEEEGDFTELVATYVYTLYLLFTALMAAIANYAWAAWRSASKVEHQHFWLLSVYAFLGTYALFAAVASTSDAIKYSQMRLRYLVTIRDLKKRAAEGRESRHG